MFANCLYFLFILKVHTCIIGDTIQMRAKDKLLRRNRKYFSTKVYILTIT